jgi:hypothetical protein
MKKVAICGTAKETLIEAPFNNPEFEIWALNDMHALGIKPHRWFELHIWDEWKLRHPGTEEYLKTCGVPVYMHEINHNIPTSVKYPIEDIISRFNRKYFQSTVDYLIALALYEGFEEIHIYGVNMAASDEYGHQKPSAEYWLGRAEGMGVEIHLPESCDLLKGYFMYGYEAKQKNDFVKKGQTRLKQLEAEAKEFQKNYYLAKGAIDTWEYILRNTKGNDI